MGGATKEEFDDAVTRFQEDDSVRVFVATLAAGGASLTLTAGEIEIFIEQDFSPTINTQAAGRIRRIGQGKTTTIINLVCPKTVDDLVADVISGKVAMIAEVLQGALQRVLEEED